MCYTESRSMSIYGFGPVHICIIFVSSDCLIRSMLLWPNRCNFPDDFATTFESQWHGSPPSSANCFTFRLRMREPSPGQQDAQVGVNMKNPEGNLPDFPLPKKRCYTSYIGSVILPFERDLCNMWVLITCWVHRNLPNDICFKDAGS